MTDTKSQELRDYLSRLDPGGLEAMMADAKDKTESAATEEAATVHNRSAATLENVARGRDLTPDEQFHVEAIIIPDKRPAIDIKNGRFKITHALWTHYETDSKLRTNIERAIKSVGRIELPGHPSYPYGGTGFVVGKGLLMTNRHVAGIFADGVGTRRIDFSTGCKAGIDFNREVDGTKPSMLAVKRVVMIHPYWDMALLTVDGLSNDPLTLSSETAAQGRDIAVIGYPAFDPRNDAAVQNKVFRNVYGVKRLQPGKTGKKRETESFDHIVRALTHDSSTLGGNSGSAVIDVKTGHVVGLHFGGVYLDANYGVPAEELARDGRVVDAGVKFTATNASGPPPWEQYWSDADGRTDEASRKGFGQPSPSPTGKVSKFVGGEARIVLPLEITVRLGEVMTPAAERPDTEVSDAPIERMVEPDHDTNYKNRKGYDPDFLGVDVPLPELEDDEVAAKMTSGEQILDYQHFSIAMHAKRRLALFTAANVTADPDLKKPEPGKAYSRKALGGLTDNDQERWFTDPRLPAQFQLSDRFFTKDGGAFDKGHLVRREDVAWGKSYQELRAANGDTYHVTNCSPQVAGFNRSANGELNWGDLENLVYKQADVERLAVFAGPVLDDNDPTFVGVDTDGPLRLKIPTRYWKIIVANTADGLNAFGFVLEQDLSDVTTEFAVPDEWRSEMRPITEIQKLTGLIFSKFLRKADQNGKKAGTELVAAAGLGHRERN